MSVNVIIDVMGKKEDVQKLWDALGKPNVYGDGNCSIDIDPKSIKSVKGTKFPYWTASGEMEELPDIEEDNFVDLMADFPDLSIHIGLYSYDKDAIGFWWLANGYDQGSELYEGVDDVDEAFELSVNRSREAWKTNWDCIPFCLQTKELALEEMAKEECTFFKIGARYCGYSEDAIPAPAEFWQDVDFCAKAVKLQGEAIRYIPKENLTKEVICNLESGLQRYGIDLQFVPEKMRTEALCLTAVQNYGRALEYVPEKLKTEEICLKAVKQTGGALLYVPEKLKTEEMCLIAVKQSSDAFKHVPDKLKTEVLCLTAVQKDSVMLEYVPEKLKTAKLCLIAIKQNGWAIEYVPDKLKTLELCLEAVKEDSEIFEFVPEELQEQVKSESGITDDDDEDSENDDYDDYDEDSNDEASNITTEEEALAAVKENGRTLEEIPEELKTKKVCLEAVKQNGRALDYVPDGHKTAEICLAAVKQKGRVLGNVPEKLITTEICLEAVKQDGSALKYVPEALKSAELCDIAMERNFFSIYYVPEKFQTEDMISKILDRLDEGDDDNFFIDNEYDAGGFLTGIALKFRERVEEKLTEVLGFGGGSFDYWMEKGNEEIEDEDYDAAIEVFNIAIELFGYGDFYAARGKAYKLNGDDDKAEADFSKAKELGGDGDNNKETTPDKKAAPQKNPALEKPAKAAPAKKPSKISAASAQKKGWNYYLKGDYENAIEMLDTAVDLNPDDCYSYGYRGETFRMMGQYDKAVEDLSKAIAMEPTNSWYYAKRGEAYLSLKQYDNAISDFTDVIKRSQYDAIAYGDRAKAYMGKGNKKLAISDLEAGLKIGSNKEWLAKLLEQANAMK